MDIMLFIFRWIYGVRRSIINRVVTLNSVIKVPSAWGPKLAVGRLWF